MKLKITDKMRAEWNARADTQIFRGYLGLEPWWVARTKRFSPGYSARTKRAAIDEAIRAEHKAKEKR